MLLDHFADLRCNRVGWQFQPGLGFRTVAFHLRAGVARNLQHGGVFAQRMDEERFTPRLRA